MGLEHTTLQTQEAVACWTEASSSGARQESKPLVGKSTVAEGLTNKTDFKQWSRSFKLLAGLEDERPKVFLDRVEAREANAPTIVPETSNAVGAPRLAQHLYAS